MKFNVPNARGSVVRSLKIRTRDGYQARRSVLRYFGGKWALAPWIIEHFPAHRIYVEPFAGGANVLLRKPRSSVEVYNDLDEEVVSIFRTIQNPRTCAALVRLLRRIPYSRREFEQAFVPSRDPIVRAARAIVRAYQGFHHCSLFGAGFSRTFSSAKHRNGGSSRAREWANYPRSLAAASERLRGVVIECRDALEVIRDQDSPDALFFVDPPYVWSTRGAAGGYRHELDIAEHQALLARLREVKGMVVLVGYPCAMYDATLHDWHRIEKPARAQGSRRPRTEVLWISPNAWSG